MSCVARVVALVVGGGLLGAQAHSWVHCTDYKGSTDYYEPGKCEGHPRPKGNIVPDQVTFGQDRGFDTQTSGCHSTALNTAQFPRAKYGRGQVVTMAWPSKNHVAADCTNKHIPDTSTKLFMKATAFTTPADDPADFTTQTQVPASFSDDPHVNNEIDFKGFQNCPKFCENMDKSLCTGTFTVPAGLADGVYTFQWNWVFNRGSPAYVTCFEAEVSGNAPPAPTPVTPTPPSPTPPAPTGPAPTPAPTSAQEASCGQLSDQCDGVMFSGSGCCISGLACQRQSLWFSQCLPSCPSDWECAETGPATPGLAALGAQCGGEFFDDKRCQTGLCMKNSPYYSECRMDCPPGWECSGSYSEHFTELEEGASADITGGWVVFWLIFSVATFIAGIFLARWWYQKHGSPSMMMAPPSINRKTSSIVMPPVKSGSGSFVEVAKPWAPAGGPPTPPPPRPSSRAPAPPPSAAPARPPVFNMV